MRRKLLVELLKNRPCHKYQDIQFKILRSFRGINIESVTTFRKKYRIFGLSFFLISRNKFEFYTRRNPFQ